jgi:deoxycytidine triphosphate deaminase
MTRAELKTLDTEQAAAVPRHPEWAQPPPDNTLTSAYWLDPEPTFQGMLASDRILAYHYKIGRMIRPLQMQHLKPASYELTLGPLCLVEGVERILTETDRILTIQPNSIVFVSMREQLLIPHWLVGRFDLAIDYIYQGLLLGTGPQVDPGFQGVLSCPLHNISSQPIDLEFCEPFAKIDFVKTSFGLDVDLATASSDEALRNASPIPGYEGNELKIFSSQKTFRPPIYFPIKKDVRKVRSSVARIESQVNESGKLVRQTRRFSAAGAVAVLALLATLFAGAVGAFVYTLTYTDGRVGDAKAAQRDTATLRRELASQRKVERSLCRDLRALSKGKPQSPGC